MKLSGYELRVFSVYVWSSSFISRVSGSSTTFSRIVPKRCEASQICGSASFDSLITFA